MIYIRKEGEPQIFSDWKNLENQEWSPTWSNFQNPEKINVLQCLIDDQKGLCCYCECELSLEDSHIEHIVPRSIDKSKELDYKNILACCRRETERGEPLTCGKSRGNWYVKGEYLDPTDINSECKITYLMDGRVESVDNRFENFIKILNLNSAEKRDARSAIISVIDDNDLNDDDIRNILDNWVNGNYYKGFISALKAAAFEFRGII